MSVMCSFATNMTCDDMFLIKHQPVNHQSSSTSSLPLFHLPTQPRRRVSFSQLNRGTKLIHECISFSKLKPLVPNQHFDRWGHRNCSRYFFFYFFTDKSLVVRFYFQFLLPLDPCTHHHCSSSSLPPHLPPHHHRSYDTRTTVQPPH